VTPEHAPFVPRRRWLWLMLVGLVAVLLVMLVWLAGRYEASQVQDQLERDANDAVGDVRAALSRNVQSLQALQFNQPTPEAWAIDAAGLLRERRELVRIEWRDAALGLRSHVDTPFRTPVFAKLGRDNAQADIAQACSTAGRFSGPAYSSSYFVSLADGLGMEVMDLCLPLVVQGRLTGHLLATYSLQDILDDVLGRQLTRSQEVSFTEADGTRLAVRGAASRGSRVFTAQQLLDLPGTTLVLRINSRRGGPDLFPNVLTALVTAMSIALISVLALLGKDIRRRLKAERELADALAFRKAMEDSLVTGLRARDLDGQITYVNPAFCDMVGFSAEELTRPNLPAPYWPPALVDEYQQRQAIRLAGNVPPREGFESVFMRKDGSLFPVLIIEAPLINAQGVQTGWMSAFLDISEQRRVEELSRASQERLQATARLATVGEMASLLSHELNQPLAAISSYATGSANLLRDRPVHATPPTALEADLALAMGRIGEQAERAGKVIKSVHDFVRRRDQAREAVAPQALLDAVLPLVSLQARKLAVRVQTEVEADLPQVLCDRTMVEQVLLNLARNAMQSMDQPGITERVLLMRIGRMPRMFSGEGDRAAQGAGQDGGTRLQKRWLAFSVADFGPGIAPGVRQRLFTPFFTTKAEGMGLGLSLCRTVVEQHGGVLIDEPNQPHGTVFTFTLPASGVE
jgi:two-component system, LuxR family, sensor histidine kinase DctS